MARLRALVLVGVDYITARRRTPARVCFHAKTAKRWRGEAARPTTKHAKITKAPSKPRPSGRQSRLACSVCLVVE